MPRLPLADWQAEQVRLTIFSMSDAQTSPQQWWGEIVNSEPDDVNMNPKKRSASVQGAYGSGMLMLRMEPGRIDWLFGPGQAEFEASIATSELPSLGAALSALETFSGTVERWLLREDLPVVGRMAFGAVLMHPETDRNAGYDRLPDYLPVQLPPESSDFLFQINRPQRSATGIDGLILNRLSKWSVIRLSIMPTAIARTSETVSLRVELDINTMPTAFARITNGNGLTRVCAKEGPLPSNGSNHRAALCWGGRSRTNRR
jgi:hypothetical protein